MFDILRIKAIEALSPKCKQFNKYIYIYIYTLYKKEKISSERHEMHCVDENALLMSEVRGEWADWMIERQQ